MINLEHFVESENKMFLDIMGTHRKNIAIISKGLQLTKSEAIQALKLIIMIIGMAINP